MTQLSPKLIGTPFGDVLSSLMNSGNPTISYRPRGPRIIEYSGALYSIYWQVLNTTTYGLRVSKSTDNGLTWAILDVSNEPALDLQAAGVVTSSSFIRDSKIYLGFDYVTLSGVTRTYTVRIYNFDCATETWSASYITGPTGSVASLTQSIFIDMCLRTNNELILLWTPVPSPGPATSYINIYNFTSATWTTSGGSAIQLFTGAGGLGTNQGECLIWDGTYIHIFSTTADTGITGYSLNARLHITMNSANTLGTEQNVLTAANVAWIYPVIGAPDPNTNAYYIAYNHPLELCIQGGKLFAAQRASVTTAFDSTNRQLIAWVCSTGVQVPTFSSEAIKTGANYTFLPSLVVIGGSLYCIHIYDATGFFENGSVQFTVRSNAGAWSTSVEFYNWAANTPAGWYGGTSLFVQNICIVPNMLNEAKFSIAATLQYGFTTSVWFLNVDLGCPTTTVSENVMY